MKWRGRERSRNVEDRRGASGMGGGGMPRIPMGGGRMPRIPMGGGLGIGGVVIILLIMFLSGNNPLSILTGGEPEPEPLPQGSVREDQQEADRREMLEVVLRETEIAWEQVFKQMNRTYKPATMVLYRDSVRSACGGATSQTGPFYCPADQKIYIDLSFYDDLANHLGARGEFAMAYVLAHEVGHHVQTLLGVSDQVNNQRQRARNEAEANDLTVRMELQADYLAGVWAHYAERAQLLEPVDIEEAIEAAEAVGDDRIQKQAQGYVVPDSFTHGTSEQRARWFLKGYEAGDLSGWDTFKAQRASDLGTIEPAGQRDGTIVVEAKLDAALSCGRERAA